MAYRFISPVNSFVQFEETGVILSCGFRPMTMCLPVFYDDDIAYQFIVEADTEEEIDLLCGVLEALVPRVGATSDCSSFDIEFDCVPDTFRIDDTHVLMQWPYGFPDFTLVYNDGDCFRIMIELGDQSFCSNCFYRVAAVCWTTRLEYSNDDNFAGFNYCANGITNKVRLPFTMLKPQFPVERTQFRKANGVTQTISAVIRKIYAGDTDNMPETWHQRLIVAFNHDSVFVINDKYEGEVTMEENNYQISWPDFKDYPLGKASFQLQVTPFDATNVNCESCEDLAQLELVDDTFPDLIAAGDTGLINVFTNDSICCSPITAEIVSINDTYVDSATIDPLTGAVEVVIKADAVSVTNAQLVTYRVTCPSGAFEDANVFGSIDGVAPEVCPPPSNIVVGSITSNSAEVTADDLNDPFIKISLCSAPTTILFTGAFTSPYEIGDHFSLSPDTCYQISIYNFCDPEISTDLTTTFTTEESVPDSGCGLYNITFNDFRPTPLPTASVTYTSCANTNLTVFVPNHNTTPVQVCMKETSPGVPVFVTTNAVVGLSYSRVSSC